MGLAGQLVLNSVFRDMISFSLVDRYQHSEEMVVNILQNCLVPLSWALPVSIEHSTPISESSGYFATKSHSQKDK